VVVVQAAVDPHGAERLARSITDEGRRALALAYEYDFGAGWTHEVALQRKLPRDPVAVYPVCTRFSGDSPVEYPEEEIWYSDDAGESDPAEPSPAEPESFDLAAVNGKLAALDGR